AVALADVEQEVGQRLGVEGLLVLVDRLAELGQRVELLATVEVQLGSAQGGIVGGRDPSGDGRNREREQEPGQRHFLRNGSRVSAGSIAGTGGFGAEGAAAGGAAAGGAAAGGAAAGGAVVSRGTAALSRGLRSRTSLRSLLAASDADGRSRLRLPRRSGLGSGFGSGLRSALGAAGGAATGCSSTR